MTPRLVSAGMWDKAGVLQGWGRRESVASPGGRDADCRRRRSSARSRADKTSLLPTVKHIRRLVVGGHVVRLAAFLAQPEPPALAVGVVVADVHGQGGLDPGEGIEADRDQRPVAEADQVAAADAVEQLAGRLGVQDRRLAFLDDVGRTPDAAPG